jgi:hypothetical protein
MRKLEQQLELLERDAELIKKWYLQTRKFIEQNVHPDSQADMVCAAALAVGGNYSKSVIELLRLGHQMPAKALLRILCELTAKLAWVIVAPRSKKKNKKEEFEKKLGQWHRATLHKRINILEEFRSIVPENQRDYLEKAIVNAKAQFNRLHGQRMPKTIEIFSKLSPKWRKGMYPRGFLQFNDAVHIDLGSLAHRFSTDGEVANVDPDSHEDISELSGYCLCFIYQIIYIVRSHFGMDTEEMAAEFQDNGRDIFSSQQPEKLRNIG